jgi:pre-mRNA-processing factor 19
MSPLNAIISCVCLYEEPSIFMIGSMEGKLWAMDLESGRKLLEMKAHEKKISSIIYHERNSILCSSSYDHIIKLWKVINMEDIRCFQTLSVHSDIITSLNYHPSGDYIVSSSLDGYWCFIEVQTGNLLLKVSNNPNKSIFNIQFHPDGLILALGSLNSAISLWDMKTSSYAASLSGMDHPVHKITFSENGYYMASSSDEEYSVRLWDLRKLTQFNVITLPHEDKITFLTFDQSGQYLALGTLLGFIYIYVIKSWNLLVTLKFHEHEITDLHFGAYSRTLISFDLHGNVCSYSIQ